MIVMTPETIGRRFSMEVAQGISAPGHPDLARVEAIMPRHNLVPV